MTDTAAEELWAEVTAADLSSVDLQRAARRRCPNCGGLGMGYLELRRPHECRAFDACRCGYAVERRAI